MADVYDTLRGLRRRDAGVEAVENLFVPGSECQRLYTQMLDAYERLCSRLGVVDEDEDVETIISSLMGIKHAIRFKMYEYGAKFGMENNKKPPLHFGAADSFLLSRYGGRRSSGWRSSRWSGRST